MGDEPPPGCDGEPGSRNTGSVDGDGSTVVLDPEPLRARVTLLPAQEPDLRHLRQVLVRYATGRVGDPHAAEDLVQDTLLVAATGARPDGPPEPYLVGVLKNKVADHFRRQGQVQPRDPEDFTGLLGADPGELPHEVAERVERATLARTLLARLSDRDRDILLLRMAGASAAETGDALGMSSGAVRVAQHRALERLRGLLVADGYDDGEGVVGGRGAAPRGGGGR